MRKYRDKVWDKTDIRKVETYLDISKREIDIEAITKIIK
jgi:hypothetical protein